MFSGSRKPFKNGLLYLGNSWFQFLRQKLINSVYIKKCLYITYWNLPEFLKSQNKTRDLLLEVNNHKKNIFFVNIGANDGLSGDPLGEFVFKHKWKGILVEPVPYVFERLKKTYKNMPNIILENVAISDVSGKKDFWHLKKTQKLNSGYDQLGSFDKKIILDNVKSLNLLDGEIIKSIVNSVTLSELLISHNISTVDVFSIDTEGYDYEIIKQIDFKKYKPRLILFEYAYLSESDKDGCFLLLKRNGYSIETTGDGINGMAIKN